MTREQVQRVRADVRVGSRTQTPFPRQPKVSDILCWSITAWMYVTC